MKNFLAIFKCAENSIAHEAWKTLSHEEQHFRTEKGMKENNEWFEKHREQIVDKGGMLGNSTKLINRNGMKNIPSQMGYYLIIKATSHDEAAQMFESHPHFTLFPGDGIEVVELTNSPRS